MKSIGIKSALILAALSVGTAAQAVQYIFTLSGAYSGSFAIDKTTPPSDFTTTSSIFENVNFSTAGLFNNAVITFDSDPGSPALQIGGIAGGPIDFVGPSIFSNTPGRPRFVQTTYILSNSLGTTMLTVRDVEGSPTPPIDGGDGSGSTVPEPATWAMMIGGFVLTGFGLRRRRVVTA